MYFSSPVADLWLDANETALTKISYTEIPESPNANQAILEQTKAELLEYFAGERQNFDVPLAFLTGTEFQRAAWQALIEIPYGQTRSYQKQAETIQRPKAVRAIGQANRNNPIAIIVPCHRVLGKSGKLTGYSGSGEKGLKIKERLLALEKNRSLPK